MSATRRPPRFILLAFIFASQTIAIADDEKNVVLSPVARRVRAWYPVDAETIIAASSFEMPADLLTRDERQIDFPSFAQLLACRELAELAKGKYLQPLVGKKVALAMRGGRNFKTFSKWGSHFSEGCVVVVFENELGESGKVWIDQLRQDAKEVRKLVGREVFVFPSSVVLRYADQAKPWLGTYFVLLAPDTLLCASSDLYLEEVLKRVDAEPADRALPDTRPEWRLIESPAQAWMLRHIPSENEDRIIDGVAWTLKKDTVEIKYLSIANSVAKVEEQATFRWEKSGGMQKLRRGADGTVDVSLSTAAFDPAAIDPKGFLMALFLDNLKNESGVVGAQ